MLINDLLLKDQTSGQPGCNTFVVCCILSSRQNTFMKTFFYFWSVQYCILKWTLLSFMEAGLAKSRNKVLVTA